MNNPSLVRCFESVRDLNREPEYIVELWLPASNALFQVQAFQQFHDDEGVACVFTNVVDGADIRMTQGRRGLRLALETPQGLRMPGEIFRKKFQSHGAAQANVRRLINFAHTPFGDERHEDEAANQDLIGGQPAPRCAEAVDFSSRGSALSAAREVSHVGHETQMAGVKKLPAF